MAYSISAMMEMAFDVMDRLDERDLKDIFHSTEVRMAKGMQEIDMADRLRRSKLQKDFDFLDGRNDRNAAEEKRYQQLRAELSGCEWVDPDADTSTQAKASQSN